MAMYVHSDKIKDPDSDRCMQAINQAKETLLDERKRKEYDRTLKTNGKKQVPEPDIGEEFHDNAYGQEEDSSDDDEAIVFDDNDVPERPPEVAAYHERFDESVIRILQNVQSKDSMGKDFGKVAKMNRKINKECFK
ncbi:chaperone protein [Colletotrichum scovillei]|uniref:chaperone protein n=1 Tax=Colletotrichum scovillei TaxID=1209932 RepID=UPI0015C2FB61|nr:chaperone protein [Colletotrichum scovillei]KAF4774664.1 chaperone protein [Colletotrichum scovillei]